MSSTFVPFVERHDAVATFSHTFRWQSLPVTFIAGHHETFASSVHSHGQTRRVSALAVYRRQRPSQKFHRHDLRSRRVVIAAKDWSENTPTTGVGLKASRNSGKRQHGAAVWRVLIIEIIGATFRRKGAGCRRNFRMVVEDGSKSS